MCRGRGEDQSPRSPSLSNTKKEDNGSIICELCSSKASLYCQADDAFLCGKCDSWVHGANFLAQRHIRCLLCSTCRRLTQRYLIGTSARVMLPAVVSLKESRQRDTNLDATNSKSVKQPFLFLWWLVFRSFFFFQSFHVFRILCHYVEHGIGCMEYICILELAVWNSSEQYFICDNSTDFDNAIMLQSQKILNASK